MVVGVAAEERQLPFLVARGFVALPPRRQDWPGLPEAAARSPGWRGTSRPDACVHKQQLLQHICFLAWLAHFSSHATCCLCCSNHPLITTIKAIFVFTWSKDSQHSQVEHQHGHHHHDEAAEGRVEVNYAEQDGGARERVHPVQPVPVQLLLVQDLPALGVQLDLQVGAGCSGPLALCVGQVGLSREEVRSDMLRGCSQ